ncbi:dihydrofolate reductase family protein [Herpetosiphon llansteffanensis]|uniref:dihydrofolate reductase family protein n=1 Tax=Herpetosiphon llansteffanensis TaxID=2094568 RepID=UPI000D7C1F77|nr:dihydrofolate reductase family protein [Herpetosiphon llansteffanensis]
MRKLVYFVACTADGFIADEAGGFDFFPMTGGHLDYIRQEYPETMPTHVMTMLGIPAEQKRFDTVLMGRHTYAVGLNEGVTSPYAHLRQYVISSSLGKLDSPDVTLVAQDPLGLVQSLKQEAGRDIWLCGGGSLASALISEIDELVLKVNPVMIGQGIRLFAGLGQPVQLELLEHQVFEGGVAVHRYGLKQA